jgi:trk system potassium uptake protein TrkH
MLLRPQPKDFQIVAYYLGKLLIGFSVFMIFPIALSFALGELGPLCDLVIGFFFCLSVGLVLHILCYTRVAPKWAHGLIIVSLSWLACAFFGAVPLFMSGHYGCFLDAYFDAMSGLTTTGLTLAQDLSHMAYGHNLWRHLLAFIGGQGVVVVVLSFFVNGVPGMFRLYVGEARDERVLPNIRHTARFIWIVSLTYLVLGSLALTAAIAYDGMPLGNALYNSVCIFMSAFDTGGFGPHDQNMMYYHSPAFEIVSLVIMLLGAINFRLHYVVWTGQRKEIWKNFEVIIMFSTIMMTFVLVGVGLAQTNVYANPLGMFRKGFYHLLSAHTGTGFQTIYPSEFVRDWGSLSLFALIVAMGLGGCVSSTTGGIKAMRLGIVFKVFTNDVKSYISPAAAVFFEKIHHIKDVILTDKQMRSALLITIAYMLLFFAGSAIGMMYGYPFMEAIFESVSAAGNVGLSCGITGPMMPAVLKITYVLQMWVGRLEFISVFALAGFFYAMVKGK